MARKLASLSFLFRRHSAVATPSTLRGVRPLRSSSYSTSSEKAENVLSSAGERSVSSGGGGGGSGRKRSLGRRALQIGLISLAGGLALSALNDLAIFHGCSSKAIEKASQNPEIVEALGVPIVRGPWYAASLAVGHRRNSVSCTFPVSGPQGSGIFQFKAIRNGEDGMFSFLRHHDWDILIMEALLYVPSNDERQQTVRISITNNSPPTIPMDHDNCMPRESESL